MECILYRSESGQELELFVSSFWSLGKDSSGALWIPESLSLNGRVKRKTWYCVDDVEVTPELRASIEHYAGAKELVSRSKCSSEKYFSSKRLTALFNEYRKLSE